MINLWTYHTSTCLTGVSSRDHCSVREVMSIHTTAYKTQIKTQSLQSNTHMHMLLHKAVKPTITDWTAAIGRRSSRVSAGGVTLLPLTANITLRLRRENSVIRDETLDESISR